MKPALEIKNLSKTYAATKVVDNLSFSIAPGEIFGLLGPNGAGKSTTINMIGGVTRIGGGEINIYEHKITPHQSAPPQAKRLTGIMHQEIVADPFFTIQQALALHPGFFGIRRDHQWYDYLIDRLQLRPHIHKGMHQLSGGLKRRFMLAKALIHKPRLLILDEPTAGVDVELRHTLWQFIRDINASGTSILLTTHYLEEAQQMCNRIAILKDGCLVALEQTDILVQYERTRHFDLHLRSPMPTIPPVLQRFNPTLNKAGTRVSFVASANDDIGAIVAELVASKMVVHDITSSEPSLEEIFLRLTRETRPKH
ncbi:MAG: ABC transporter ATP-binding protein [Desulfuromonadaceae bacterium]|nr:ABC transporter ATP-binding protein [Desulfuromonas sp.]MDY0184903.1 ABC transporter ATP-binding protein [Desulfuromonadaceae bacterium]